MFDTAQPQADDSANQPESIYTPEPQTDEPNAYTQDGYGEEEGSGEPFMTVRYNKRDTPLSKQEAVSYAQKGMNYDKLQERLMETTAKLSLYEGKEMPPEQYGQHTDKQAVVDGQLESFMRGNPGVDPRGLPQSVISAWKRGMPLSEAYLAHQSEVLSEKVRGMEKAAAQAEANRKNEAASMGGAVSNSPARARAISEDSIRSMTPQELEKNHERIWTYLTQKGPR